jgi:3-oxoacyl-[acyl-carrier protein] reductase
MTTKRFEQQTVIVTGGTRGIGAAITQAFLEEGATVVASYVRDEKSAFKFRDQLGDLAHKLHLKAFNVSEKKAVDQFFEWYKSQFEKLDVLINNSGIRRDQILASLSENEWDEVIDTNLKGTYLMSQQAVLLMMQKRYGRIIQISSIGGKLGLPGQANYAASKAGQLALTMSLAKEVGKRKITVNCVCPGFIETDLLKGLPEEQIKDYQQQVPLKRFGTAQEVAHAVLFLASPQAGYITGTSLDVAGGLHA